MPKIVNLPGRARRKSRPGGTGEKYLAALAAADDTPRSSTATLTDRAHMAYSPQGYRAEYARHLNARARHIVGVEAFAGYYSLER